MFDFLRKDNGAAAAEYALILAIVGVGMAAAVLSLGESISDAMTNGGVQIVAATESGSASATTDSGSSSSSSSSHGKSGQAGQGSGQANGNPPDGRGSGPPESPPGKPDVPGSNGKGNNK